MIMIIRHDQQHKARDASQTAAAELDDVTCDDSRSAPDHDAPVHPADPERLHLVRVQDAVVRVLGHAAATCTAHTTVISTMTSLALVSRHAYMHA